MPAGVIWHHNRKRALARHARTEAETDRPRTLRAAAVRLQVWTTSMACQRVLLRRGTGRAAETPFLRHPPAPQPPHCAQPLSWTRAPVACCNAATRLQPLCSAAVHANEGRAHAPRGEGLAGGAGRGEASHGGGNNVHGHGLHLGNGWRSGFSGLCQRVSALKKLPLRRLDVSARAPCMTRGAQAHGAVAAGRLAAAGAACAGGQRPQREAQGTRGAQLQAPPGPGGASAA